MGTEKARRLAERKMRKDQSICDEANEKMGSEKWGDNKADRKKRKWGDKNQGGRGKDKMGR